MHTRSRLVVMALVVGASSLSGQGAGVHLRLRPRAGDTLHVRMDQTIEMSRSSKPNDDDSEGGDVASLVLLARIAIEGADAEGATVLALADSVRVSGTGGLDASPSLRAARAMQGQRFRFRVQPDGGTMLTGADPMLQGISGLFSQLPATLPREKLSPGDSWVRAVEIPLAATPDGRGTATLNATFRFDSLSHSDEYAYLSVRGRLVRAGQVVGSRRSVVQTAGDVTGKILIDLRRGWIADARSVVTLRSLISGGSGKESGPTRVRVKITQWMRVI